MQPIPPQLIDEIVRDKKIRVNITRRSHRAFFSVFLSHYVRYPSAPFHDELFSITEDESIQHAVVTAFRGSAKSTIMTLSYPLWAVLGKQNKKFILILAHTINQAKAYMKNIREELENNTLLRNDLGPFQEENEWHSFSVVIPRYNARIMCASYEQGIRGLRYGQHRPDLIIADDIEDLESVKTLEGRDKTYNWLKGEVIPAGDRGTRLMVIGNLLHEDSLIMRLKKEIKNKTFNALYREYPLLDHAGKVAWPGKFPTKKSILEEKQKIGSESAWQREYMLTIIADSDRVIQPSWIRYYDHEPTEKQLFVATGVDPAISERDAADFTGMVSAKVYGRGKNLRIHILANPVNKHLSFSKLITKAKEVSDRLGEYRTRTPLYFEDVAFQAAYVETLRREGYPVKGIPLRGLDKRTRLMVVSPALENGQVFFPRQGAENLISQLLGFHSEKHDDLVDAFTLLLGEVIRHYGRDVVPLEVTPDSFDDRPIFADLLDRQF